MSESELIDELLEDAKGRMAKSVDSTRSEFATVRTGRASPPTGALCAVPNNTRAATAAKAASHRVPKRFQGEKMLRKSCRSVVAGFAPFQPGTSSMPANHCVVAR